MNNRSLLSTPSSVSRPRSSSKGAETAHRSNAVRRPFAWRFALGFASGALALSLCAMACGGGGSSAPFADAGGDQGGADAAPPVDLGGDAALPEAGSLGCSADLRALTDATGRVVATCPDDQGCSSGRCVPACEAAASSKGNVGCGFLVPTPPGYPPALPPCHAVFLTNTWPTPAAVTVERDGTTLDVGRFARIVANGAPESSWSPLAATGIPPGEVAVLFLSSDPASVMPDNQVSLSCPVTPAVDGRTVVAGSGKGKAFRIRTSAPVGAYDILPYGGARSHFPSASLLFPTTAWGDNYVVLGTPLGTHSAPGPIWTQIVATEPNTEVRVLPVADLPAAGGLPAIARGTTGTFTLQPGEYAQWEVGAADVSGSVVLADKPVALFAGNRFYRQQPEPKPGGESTHQQNLPVSALGNEYVGAPFETRRQDLAPEVIRYRLVGAVDGTQLTFDPPVAGAPAALERGVVADFATSLAFVVRSQDAAHPFAAAQLMDTANVQGGSRPGAVAPGFGPWLGDEELVTMLPPAQFLSRYVFFADTTYPTTNVVVVRTRGRDGFRDVRLGCLGTIGGWQPVSSGGRYEIARVDLVRANTPNGQCGNGRHVAESEAPFGITVWGLDSYSSYAYPGGGNAATLSTVRVVPQPR
jgi:hypothetical protein